MVRYILVAGVYAAAVLAAPAQNAAEVGATPAGWGDNSPSFGSALFGWARPNHNKPEDSESGSSSLYAPSASRGWGDLFGGDRGTKGGSGAGSSASQPPRDWGSLFGGSRGGSGSDSSAPPKASSGGGFFGSLFGGSRPKPASSSSGSSGSSPWWRPRPESAPPKPEWKPDPKPEWKPEPKPEPKPAASESSDESESSESVPVPKPEPAQPKPEAAKPKPESAAPVPTAEAKPEPAQPKPESAAPVPAPTPLEPKPEAAESDSETAAPDAVPKPAEQGATDTSEFACGTKSLSRYSGDIESVRRQLWQPSVSSKWQIILDGVPDTKAAALKPLDAHIWDIDAWDASGSDICDLKKQKKKVICYFSAGTSETWRDDNVKLKDFNLGAVGMTDKDDGKVWKGEEWVDIREPKVREVMKTRIKMAAEKGCDAIDPDNIGKSHNYEYTSQIS
jgi:hypothetical protein